MDSGSIGRGEPTSQAEGSEGRQARPEPQNPLSHPTQGPAAAADVARRSTTTPESTRAARQWWDAAADAYQADHGEFLRDDGFVWCPEGLDEAEAHLLGPVAGRRVLEVGCGAGQCTRWLIGQGARAAGVDLSAGQLRHAAAADRRTGIRAPVAQADALTLPFADRTFDVACSAYGAVPFVSDSAALMTEVARVVRPGGRWVFSVTHPVRWCFPDDPGPEGLQAQESYYDRRPYVEVDGSGRPTYVEHHRTLGDRVRELTVAGFTLTDLVEPEWPDGLQRVWGAWSPLRGRILPGTAIFVCTRNRETHGMSRAGDGETEERLGSRDR